IDMTRAERRRADSTRRAWRKQVHMKGARVFADAIHPRTALRSARRDRIVERVQPLEHRLLAIEGERALATGLPHGSRARRVAQERLQGRGEVIHITRRDEQTGLAIDDRIDDAAD